MKRVLRSCATLAVCAWAVLAVDWKALKPQGYVSDFAGVVDAASRAQLERYCGAVERASGAQIALVTLRSLEGEPGEDVANTIFRAWGVGRKGSNEGIMLLLSIGDRTSRLEVGYGLEPYIPDGFAGSILREMRPALSQQQYGAALMAAAQTIGSRIAQAKGVSLDTQLPRRARQRSHEAFPWPALLGGAFLLFWLMRAGSRGGRGPRGGGGGGLLAGIILGQMMSRSGWGGRGGGGFGGFDSGDGFGGFGGGDSGGGGASSNW